MQVTDLKKKTVCKRFTKGLGTQKRMVNDAEGQDPIGDNRDAPTCGRQLERQMQGGAATVQLKASLIEVSDAAKLAACVQSAQSDSDDEQDSGEPAAAVYKSQSGGIVDTIQELLERADDQLAELRKREPRKRETNGQNKYGMWEQSLKDEIRFATKGYDDAKKGNLREHREEVHG